MFIPFPIALFVSTFVDLICWQTNNNAWATASLWVYWLERVGHGTAWALLVFEQELHRLGDSRSRNSRLRPDLRSASLQSRAAKQEQIPTAVGDMSIQRRLKILRSLAIVDVLVNALD
jgi:hypothetical protein